MLIVAGTIRVEASKKAALEEAFDRMRAATLLEPGCLEYQVFADRKDASVLLLFEKWKDEASLQSHFTSPHMAEFAGAIGAIGILGREITKYEIASQSPM